MKKLLVIALMLMVLPSTSYALEVTVIDAGIGSWVTWDGPGTGSGFAGEIITSIGSVYCVELGQDVNPGGVYQYTPVTPSGAYIRAAWLVNQFGASADTQTEAAGLQAAIWAVIYGNGFKLTGTTDIQKQQISYLNQLSDTVSLPAGYTILANKDSQDLLIARVPEPMTMLLLGLGLVGLAGLRRKE